MAKRRHPPQKGEHVFHGRRLNRDLDTRFGLPAYRLTHCESNQNCQQDPGQAHDEERHPPSEELVDPAAREEPEQDAEVDAGRVDRECRRATLGRKIVGEQ